MCASTRGLLLGAEDVPVVGSPPTIYELCCIMTQRFSPAHVRVADIMRVLTCLPPLLLYLNVCVSLCTGFHLAGYVWIVNIVNSVSALLFKIVKKYSGGAGQSCFFQRVNCVFLAREVSCVIICYFGGFPVLY
jgi:hypothetical protein